MFILFVVIIAKCVIHFAFRSRQRHHHAVEFLIVDHLRGSVIGDSYAVRHLGAFDFSVEPPLAHDVPGSVCPKASGIALWSSHSRRARTCAACGATWAYRA